MFKLALVALLAFSSAEAFWSPCASILAPTLISSPFCSGNLCVVGRGDTLVADASITFPRAHNRLDVRVTAFIFGLPVNLPQTPPDDNACNSLYRGGSLVGCPTVPGTSHVWRINFFVPSTFPAFTNTRVRFELLENGVTEVCADVQATLQ